MTVLQDDRAALALRALAEVTDPASVGELIEVTEPTPGVRDLIFSCRLPGYIGWRWTVSTAQAGDAEPTVLEVELLPGEGSLVAPPWVPWAERLAEYRRTHPDEADEGADDEADEDDDDLDDDDLDDVDDDDEVDADALEIDGVDFEDVAEDDGDAAEDDDEPARVPDDEPPTDDEPATDDESTADEQPVTRGRSGRPVASADPQRDED